MAVHVGIIMGSQSDWPTMKAAAEILDELGVAYETKIVSAHRTPDRLWDYGKTASSSPLGKPKFLTQTESHMLEMS